MAPQKMRFFAPIRTVVECDALVQVGAAPAAGRFVLSLRWMQQQQQCMATAMSSSANSI
jgi:hypothetical protein